MRITRYALLLVLMVVIRVEAESDSENHQATKRTIPARSTVAVDTPAPVYPVITTQKEFDQLPAGAFFFSRDKPLKKQTPTQPLAPMTTSVGLIKIPASEVGPTGVVALLLIAGIVVFLLWKTVFVWLKPKVCPQKEPIERHPQVCSDYGHYQVALKRWKSDRQLFEKVESDRLKELGAWASKGGPLTGLAFLVGIVVTVVSANRAGSGAGWGTGIGSLIAVGAVMNAEEHFRRWRHQALFVRQEFNEPAPVYVPSAQPPPRNEPPPRQEPSPNSARVDQSIQKVTTMRQAYANLGIPPGRISITRSGRSIETSKTNITPTR
jgi:hypothetical protein